MTRLPVIVTTILSFTISMAMAAQEVPIATLPTTGTVTISGTVAKVENEREFTLNDASGKIEVKLPPNESTVLKEGDNITVTGTVENRLFGLLGKKIQATNVQVHKDLPTAMSEAVTKMTGLTFDKANAVNINQLPTHGEVKVTGTVKNVSNEKHFTLQDATGGVDVEVQSAENAALTEGARVTIVGHVDNGILGKKIIASSIIVDSNAPAGETH